MSFAPGELFTLAAGALTAKISPFGGTMVELLVPDRNGKPGNIILGYDSIKGYREGGSYFGGLVGRYANRIAGARFTLDGVEYRLTPNQGENQLHGGPPGFHKVWWRVTYAAADSLELENVSPDGANSRA